MISHFWNLCRAPCQALEVDKLHSEYRSTYRWHEYTPKHTSAPVVRKPPAPSNNIGLSTMDFPHKRTYPEVAYKSHEFFDTSLAVQPDRPTRATGRQPATSPQRRSQSEGPVKRNPLFQSEYRMQFAASGSRRNRDRRPDMAKERVHSQEAKVTSFPPQAPSATWGRRSARSKDLVDVGKEPKKSVSLSHIQPASGQVQATGHQPASGQVKPQGQPQHDLQDSQPSGSKEVVFNGVPDENGNVDVVDSAAKAPGQGKNRDFKSEYKNKFRPFSQYEYVGDGKFFNTSGSPPSERDGPSSLVKIEKVKQEKLEGEPWYQEVIELRRAAADYKCRGWGTDMVPPHMTQLYTQQINLHEQAAKRESLSALALAISTPRSLPQEEREKESQRKDSPTKARSRPKTAPPKALPAKRSGSSRAESAHASPAPTPKPEKVKDNEKEAQSGRSTSLSSPARRLDQSAKPNLQAKAHVGPQAAKSSGVAKPRQRPTTLPTNNNSSSAAAAAHSNSQPPAGKAKPAKKIESGAATEDKEDNKRKSAPPRDDKPKPAPAKKAPRQELAPQAKKEPQIPPKSGVEAKKLASRGSSKPQSRDTSRPPSAIENHIDYFREPVVKSPPEPTRVKSPEQIHIRSPDPINWTVPLDTGKTFSVTQTVRDSDSTRNSPMSDNSNHFESTAGTTVNLGLHSVNEKGSLHYPKVSALAREAMELQGKKTAALSEARSSQGLSGESKPTQGKENSSPAFNGTSEPSKNSHGSPVKKPVAAPTTGLKCLEDPNFAFDDAATTTPPSAGKPAAAAHPPPSSTAVENGSKAELVKPAATAAKSAEADPKLENTGAKKDQAESKVAAAGSGTPAQAQQEPSKAAAGPAKAGEESVKPAAPSSVNNNNNNTEEAVSKPTQPKRPTYRVLEDPDLDLIPHKGSPYKVLEDPSMMTTSIYQPRQETNKARPDEVLEGARHQFDKFFKGN